MLIVPALHSLLKMFRILIKHATGFLIGGSS
jgi:hypothetical protein